MYTTYHPICKTTLTAVVHENQPYKFQHCTLTQLHVHPHIQHINTGMPTEAGIHWQYTQARTRGNVRGWYRTLSRHVPDLYICMYISSFFAQRKKSLNFLEEGSLWTLSDKVHFTLQWMDIILKKSWIINSQLHSFPAWIVKHGGNFSPPHFNQPLYIQWSPSVCCFYMRPTNNDFLLPGDDIWVSGSYCLWDPPEGKKNKTKHCK